MPETRQTEIRSRLFLGFFCAAAGFVLGLRPLRDFDTWWHLATGEWILKHGIPYTDPFSFTAQGLPWIHLEWGGSVLLWRLYQWTGLDGLVFLQVAVFSAYLYLCARCVQLLARANPSPSPLPLLTVVLAGFLSLHRMMARPDLFSHLFVALELYLLYRYLFAQASPKESKALFWLPALFVCWANIHGNVLIGLGLFGLFCMGSLAQALREGALRQWDRRLPLILAASLLVVLANPYTYQIYLFPIEHLTLKTILAKTYEWMPPYAPNWLALLHIRVYFILLATCLFFALKNFRKIRLEILFVGLGMTYLSLKAGRFTAIFAFWATGFLAAQITDSAAYRRFFAQYRAKATLWLHTALPAALILIFALTGVPITLTEGRDRMGMGSDPNAAPVQAVEFLKRNGIRQNIYNSAHLGAYLILNGFPVFIDGRTPIYGDEFVRRYLDSDDPKIFEELRAKWPFSVVFLSRKDQWAMQDLHRYLIGNGDWAMVYEDNAAYVYLLRTPENDALIRKEERKDSSLHQFFKRLP